MTKDNPFGPQGWTPERVGDLTGKTIVITGANAGAGYEATRIFLARGANVVMLNRSAPKSEAAIAQLQREFGPEANLRFIRMDLADLASVRDAAAQVLAEVPRIDVLIENAAIAQVAKQQLTKDGFESQLGTNHMGHFLLTRLLFDRLVKNHARIVVVGSNGRKMGLKRIQFEDMNFDRNYNPHITYCHSKFAQMMFAYELERRIVAAGLPVSVHVCHPGAARTTLSKDEANRVTKILFTLLSPLAQSAERGAWPEVLCATEENLKPAAYYGPTKRAEMVGPVGACTLEESVLYPKDAAWLWELSETLTGTSWSIHQYDTVL
jgi:NAD(P)-dependent dehydrogenase (short-subunit alcohol dehydrogenase family)